MRDAEPDEQDEALFRPILETGPWFYATAAGLAAVVLWALYAYSVQLRYGLGVTGLSRPVFWGVYIVHFVFFVGISHAGTLISAILRLCQAEWRRPITRSAEVITVLVLFFGVGNIILDLGRPDRLFYVLRYPRFTSPLLWDVTSISTYLSASLLYLYLPLIPDIALLRDRVPGWRHGLYRALALGWRGTDRQRRWLHRGIAVMAVLVIPIAVSVHTVVSWVFGMTVQPLWRSSIFGPFFVMGAIYSGIAALILAMGVIRRGYGLQAYLKPIHFRHLGTLLLVLNLLWFYFTFAEHITVFYGKAPHEMRVFGEHLQGRYAGNFWLMVGIMAVVFVLLAAERLPLFAAAPAARSRGATLARLLGTGLGLTLAAWLFTRELPGHAPADLVTLHVERAWGIVALAGTTLLWWRPVKRHPIAAVLAASTLVIAGMWLERLIIVVPTLMNPVLPWERGSYQPTWVEWSLFLGAVAAFVLLYMLFTKLFPIVSIWEIKEGRERALHDTEERIRSYLPDAAAEPTR